MNRIILPILFIAFIVGGISKDASAQCKQQVVYQCATNIDKAIYLRDFNTKLRKGKKGKKSGTRWAVLLNRGTHYRFTLCTQGNFENSVVLTLFDAKHPETKPYQITKYTGNKRTSNRFEFICNKTGTYYLSIRFKKGKEAKKSCAVGIMSFVGKNK